MDKTATDEQPAGPPLGLSLHDVLGEPVRERELRVEWRIAGHCGGGRWRPSSAYARRALQAYVDSMCEDNGPGTHWISERDA